MTTSHDPDPQTVIAFYIGLGFTQRLSVSMSGPSVVDQTLQQVQHLRLGRDALIQSQLHSADDNLFVVMKAPDQEYRPSRDHRRSGNAFSPAVVEGPAANSMKGAPLRKALGLRWMAAR